MKILHIIHKFDPKIGGPYQALNNIIQLEKILGYDSDVLSSNEKGVTLEKNNFNLYLFEFSFPKRFSRSKELLMWLKIHFEEYDLFILHGVWTSIYLETSYFLMKNGKKYIIRPAGSLGVFDINLRGKKWLKNLIGNLFLKNILTSSYFLFLTSKMEKDNIVLYYSSPKIEIMPVPFAKLNKINHDLIEFDFSKTKSKLKVLYLSRIETNKGIFELLSIFKKFKQDQIDCHLFIGGEGKSNCMKLLNNQIKDNLLNNVTVLGFIEKKQKKNLFENVDLLILPSKNENFGNIILESLYFETPVLVTNKVPLSEVVEEQNCGWVCEPTEESVYKKLIYIINSKTELKEQKENCLKTVNLFSIDALASLYKEKYEQN